MAHSLASARLEPILVAIPGGWFVMGSLAGQDNEQPLHRVWVDDFHLCATQVTNAEYLQFCADTGSAPPPLSNDENFNLPLQPVTAVSWFQAQEYCAWLTSTRGKRFRLPTEAEWEYAARGGAEQHLFPWGNEPPHSLPDYHQRWIHGPEIVARFGSHGFGLYNMCENVHEWCSDWFAPDYYSHSPERNPMGPESGDRKSSRGGSWRHHIKVSRCSARSSIPPHFQYADYGFRVACDSAGLRANR